MSSAPRATRVLLALVAAIAPIAAHAEDRAPEKIIKDASAAIAAQKSMSIAATIEYRGKFQGSEEALDTTYTIDFDRANGLAVHVENADDEMFVYRTNDKTIHYIPAFKQFTTADPTASPEEVVTSTGFTMIESAMAALGTIVTAAPFEGAFSPANLQYVGAEPIDSKPCDRVRFDAKGYTYDVWVDQDNHQIRRIEPDMKPLEEKFSAEYGTTFDFTVTANITKWDANADVTKTIAFAAPEGVESVARFSPPHEQSEAEKMAGAPAPDFTLPLLAGGEMTLSKEKGNVVILDFWATWCGPCRIAMPAVEEVIKDFAGKNVKLYSVNGGEDADTVKSFLEQSKLDVPVALDTESTVTALYKAEAIPQTVIIGPDGVIRIVHVGLWSMPEGDLPESREEAEKLMHEALVKSLREEIQAVLATADTKK